MNNYDAVSQSLKIIVEMLNDRGIQIQLPSDMLSSKANKILFEVILNDIKIVYYLNPKFKWSELKKTYEDEEENKKYSLHILVVKDKVSQSNMKIINALGINLQIFDIKELQFNITKHVLVPKHTVVKDEKEVEDILVRYSLKSKFQLPIILRADPMARYLNLKNGDIVKITRVSPSSGDYVVYRCCL